MIVPIQTIEESLSIAYAHAIISKTGIALPEIPDKDFGVDIRVKKLERYKGKVVDMGVIFDCQLKATINWSDDGTVISYDLDSDSYNKLVFRYNNSTTICFLVVHCLPREEEKWISLSDNELILRKCSYYYHINGEETNNSSSIRIKIPKNNRFTPENVIELIKKIRKGEIK